MKVVEMIYEVTETCQNGNERTHTKKVYAKGMFRFEEGKKMLERMNYYNVVLLEAKWKDIPFIEQ